MWVCTLCAQRVWCHTHLWSHAYWPISVQPFELLSNVATNKCYISITVCVHIHNVALLVHVPAKLNSGFDLCNQPLPCRKQWAVYDRYWHSNGYKKIVEASLYLLKCHWMEGVERGFPWLHAWHVHVHLHVCDMTVSSNILWQWGQELWSFELSCSINWLATSSWSECICVCTYISDHINNSCTCRVCLRVATPLTSRLWPPL